MCQLPITCPCDPYQACVCCLQSSGEPHSLAQQEAARRDALAAQDPAAVRRQEMYIIATLLNSQFGPARVDEEQGLVLLEVGGCSCQLMAAGGCLPWCCQQ